MRRSRAQEVKRGLTNGLKEGKMNIQVLGRNRNQAGGMRAEMAEDGLWSERMIGRRVDLAETRICEFTSVLSGTT